MATELKVVMFTDQVKSTPNTALRTPAEIKQVSRAQDELTSEVARQNQGRILKDTGDGHLIEFLSCRAAVLSGLILQQRVNERNQAQTTPHLRFEFHIGIDLGELVILENGDIRGNAANLAARVCSECPPGEVYFTEKVSKELHPREAQTVEVGQVQLKGVQEKVTLYRLAQWLGKIQSGHNPFIWRTAITKAEDFFDRDNEQQRARAYLRGGQNCQIVSPRRIGKSSFLRQIERVAPEWEETVAVAYLDLQDPRCFTLSGWLNRASRQLDATTPLTNLTEFANHVETMLSDGRRPVLCLDEVEELTSRRAEFTRDFFLTLRSCGQQGMSISTASEKPLSELTDHGDPTSPFYNTFPIVRLDRFSDQDAKDFVTLHRPGVPPFNPEEKETILNFAKGHPLALQVACFHILQAKENRENLATAMRRADDDMRVHLRGGW